MSSQTEINERIDYLIKLLGFNRASFAKKIGVKPTVIYNIVDEKGRRSKPSFDLIYKIANSFSFLNLEWLIKGEGNPLIHQYFQKTGEAELTITEGVEDFKIEQDEMSFLIKFIHLQEDYLKELKQEVKDLRSVLYDYRNKLIKN